MRRPCLLHGLRYSSLVPRPQQEDSIPEVQVAVCAGTGTVSALILPEINTAVVNLFLEQFARELPAGVHAVPIWDGAGYHTGSDLVIPLNVSLIVLPPYSPELNPVEDLWY